MEALMIKNQDILVLATLMGSRGENMSYAKIADKAKLSVSESFAAVNRLREASLINSEKRINRTNAIEFLTHALRYICPASYGSGTATGIPASYAAPVAADDFAVAGEIPVWPCDGGNATGRPLEPIYPSAPKAAAADRRVYDNLAIFDMLRCGRLRERAFAAEKLREIL
jgi:hypothetical protein